MAVDASDEVWDAIPLPPDVGEIFSRGHRSHATGLIFAAGALLAQIVMLVLSLTALGLGEDVIPWWIVMVLDGLSILALTVSAVAALFATGDYRLVSKKVREEKRRSPRQERTQAAQGDPS
jgi:membrane protein implicated in regulation of membrane protease activity